jgi:DNA-binding NtrC family response regulator
MEKFVLLIDDDRDELDIFQEALQQAELPFSTQCTHFESIEKAIDYLRNFKVDYVFIDYNMPRTNGLQSLTLIRKSGFCDGVPVILYSAFIDNAIEEKALQLGAYSFLRKPVKSSVLSRKLQQILLTA